MTVDIGKVFSDTWAMIKQRWLAMIGLWAAFVGVLILFYIGTIIAAGTWFVTFADAFNGAGGFADATAYGGLGIGFVVITVLIMVGFYTIIFGQFGSMVAMASPTRRPSSDDRGGPAGQGRAIAVPCRMSLRRPSGGPRLVSGRDHHPAAPINSRPISIRRISLVPAPISSSLASRM